MKKYGGFVPGFRPGTPTERPLAYVSNGITAAGALYIGISAQMEQRSYPALMR
ncbi:hypothetical protein ACW0JT_15385 [Arthrobacter sp. SA17]